MRSRSDRRWLQRPGAGLVLVVLLVSVPVLSVSSLLLVLAIKVPAEALLAGHFGWGDLAAAVTWVLVSGFALYVLWGCEHFLLRLMLHGTWLVGTRLYERAVVRVRSVDLATAHVELADVHFGRSGLELTTVLRATDPASALTVETWVGRNRTRTLPAPDLTALADAITHNRARLSSEDAAFVVADQLRQLATSADTPV